MRTLAKAGDGLNRAHFIVGKHDRGQIGFVAKCPRKRRLIDHAAIGHICICDIEPFARKRTRAVQNGGMLERRSHETALAALRLRLRAHASLNGPVVRFGAA